MFLFSKLILQFFILVKESWPYHPNLLHLYRIPALLTRRGSDRKTSRLGRRAVERRQQPLLAVGVPTDSPINL